MRVRRSLITAFVCLAVAALTGGCAAPPPPPPPTVVSITVRAAPDVNPDPTGRPSPIVARIYQLAAPSAFDTADYFKLFEQETATLGGDLVSREELRLAPGQTQSLTREMRPNARFIGVAASYRDLQNAIWHASFTVPPNATTPVTVSLGRLAVTLTAAPGR